METAGRAVLFAGTTVVISLDGPAHHAAQLRLRHGHRHGRGRGHDADRLAHPAAGAPRLRRRAGRGHAAAGPDRRGPHRRRPHRRRRRHPRAVRWSRFPSPIIVLLASLAVPPLRKRVLEREPKPLRETLSYRWSRVIQRRPWPAVILGTGVLLSLALPILGLRLGFSDEGNYPEDTTTRQAYDLLAEGFGPGFNGALVLASEVPEGTDPAALQAVSDAIQADPGVAFVSPPISNEGETAALWRVIPTTAPQDAETTDLVNRLRDDVLPPTTEGTGLDVAVAGGVAIGVDFTEYLVGPAAVVLRGGARPVVPAPDGGLPVIAGPAQGRGHEPAVYRRRLRHRRRGVPVGLGRRPAQHRGRPDRAVRAHDAVRHRVRALDGLRGVPALPDQGGVGPHGRQPSVGGRRVGRSPPG